MVEGRKVGRLSRRCKLRGGDVRGENKHLLYIHDECKRLSGMKVRTYG